MDGLIFPTDLDVDLGPCDRPALLPAALRTYLVGCRALARIAMPEPLDGHLFRSHQELVYELGRPMFAAAKLPRAAPRGNLRYCYANTLRLIAYYPRLRYCEGYAMPWVDGRAGTPALHAWAVNSTGRVWDPTWPDPFTSAYWGIEIPLADVLRFNALDVDTFGVLATEHLIGSPMLRTGRLFPEG